MTFIKYLLFLILFSTTSYGQEALVFNDSLKIESLVPYIEKMEGEVVDSITFKNITTQKFKQIKSPKLGSSEGEYWFRFKVQNTYSEQQLMIIFMKGMSMYKFNIFKEIEGEGLIKIKSLKKGLSLKNRLIPHKYEELLKLEAKKTTYFYINVFYPKSVIIDLKAGKTLEKAKLDQKVYVKEGSITESLL